MAKQKEMMENILKFREETDAFKKSIESRSEKMRFKFYDWPPFASWQPHYWHLLASSIKDLVPRFMTMKWYRVNRKWWWDCHWLPVENKVEKELWIESKRQIEEGVGIDRFTQECRNYVMQVNDEWFRFVNHVWRWVDIENAYFTMDKSFMESVINVFSSLYKKNLIFKGFKIQWYCPRCATTLSNHEMNEWYAPKQDKAITVKMPLKEKDVSKFSQSEDGFIDIVAWVSKNSDWKYLMIYHQKENLWLFPGGKVESWESLNTALGREIEEELGVSINNQKYIGSIKIIHTWKPYRVNYFDIDLDGEASIQEKDKHTSLQWVERIDSDNKFWFWLKFDGNVFEEENSLTKEFVDFYIFEKVFPQFSENMNDLYDWSFNFLIWTTTPWTLPANMFMAVWDDIDYFIVFDKQEKQYFVLAEDLFSQYYTDQDNYVFIYKLKWEELKGISYKPLFDFYTKESGVEQKYKDNSFKILSWDFVSTEDGTWIVHIAPSFWEDDYNLVIKYWGVFQKDNVSEWLFMPIDEYGIFTSSAPCYEWWWVFDVNEQVVQDLKKEWKIVKIKTINHNYPYCRRCDTPLIYRAIDSWFVDETSQKEKLLKESEKLKFVPLSIKKRFVNIINSAPDWNISRNRYWWAPIPVWECENCSERKVVWSIQEIQELSWEEVKDLHRPHIDKFEFECKICGSKMKRVPDVLDCWFESGSMPYGETHYPFEEQQFVYPADFIAEGIDQTRWWFRALHVLWTLLMWERAFDNVVINWMILGEDGSKLSKKLKNYPDPKYLLDNYWADAFRLFILSTPLVKADAVRFSESSVEQTVKDFVLPLENVYNFFKTYADIDGYKNTWWDVYFMKFLDKNYEKLQEKSFIEKIIRINPDIVYISDTKESESTAEKISFILKEFSGKDVSIKWNFESWKIHSYINSLKKDEGKQILILGDNNIFSYLWENFFDISDENNFEAKNLEIIKIPTYKVTNELDKWILAEVHNMMLKVEDSLENYYIDTATKFLMNFMDKLTNWYLRRSRRRFWASGMSEDKNSAYNTLFEVLKLYLKIAAPFAPFITEDVWHKLMKYQDHFDWESLHIEYLPIPSSKYIDEDLMEEIKKVRSIIKSALYIRSRNKIKIKQPLKKLEVRL